MELDQAALDDPVRLQTEVEAICERAAAQFSIVEASVLTDFLQSCRRADS
jgi:hypothetical protein